MKKLIYYLAIIVFSACAFGAGEKSDSFTIQGISGKELTNVQQRLEELELVKPLNQIPEEDLSLEIQKALQPFGYFHSQIRIQQDARPLIDIVPGPYLLVSSLTLKMTGPGAHYPELLEVSTNLPLKTNQPLSMEQYNKLKLDLINTAEGLGFLHASFTKAEVLVDVNTNSAQIDLIFDTGILYHFGDVHFDPTYIKPELLHRFVPFQPGQAYSTKDILKLNTDLSASGYFNSIQVLPQIGESQSVPVLVHLQPVSKYSYSLGGGYGTDTGVRGRAALHVNPVNRKGHKFNATAQGSLIQNILQAQYVVPGTNPVADQYSLTGNFSSLNYDAGYSNASSLSLAYQHNLDNFHRTLSLNALYENFHYTLLPNTSQFLLYPKASYNWTRTTNPLFSPSGYNVSLTGLGASKLALSEINMAEFVLDAKAAYTLDRLRLRLFGHLIQGVSLAEDVNQIPLSLALLLGGMENLKGYSYNSIGPGKALSYAGVEVQKETKKNWYAIAFVDAGTVYNPDFKNNQYDFGLALMWVSPIGPIKIGAAQPVNSQFQIPRGSSPRLVISMGPDL